MKAILSHQSLSPNGKDILVKDGEICEFNGTTQQIEAQELTNLTNDAKLLRITRLFRFFGASSSLRMYSDKNKFWVISNFKNKDEIGRKIAYVFFCDETDNPNFVKRLFIDYCSIAKMEPAPKDCDAIEKALKFEKTKKRNLIIAILIAIISLIVFTK